MNARRTVQQVIEDAERSGRSGECELGGHRYCHPQDVYARDIPSPGERPIFSIRCTCACHKATAPSGS